MYDAVIVGAGPAGSASAALLARRGAKVLLLDRAAFPRDKACGEYTSPQTERVLERLGVLEEVRKAGARRLETMRVISPNGRSVVLDYAGNGEARQMGVLTAPRRVLDALLVEHARRCGAEVRERVKVEGVATREGQATGVVCKSRNGRSEEIAARLVVGADGVHSAVVRSLGLAATLRWPQNLGMVAHYEGYNGLDDWGEMHVSARGYAGLAPLSGGLVNVGLVMPMSSRRKPTEQGTSELFEDFALSFPQVRRVLAGAHRVTSVRGVGPIGARVKRTSGAGFMLVGDAAGFFDPFTGEGVYKALRGAELLAEVATAALAKDDLSAQSLARYSALRRAEFTAKDVVCRLVQGLVGLPPAMDYVVARLERRERARRVMAGVIGDYMDARAALSPAYMWTLLRP
jgi:geranylgeranyl reductase family protein